MTAANKSSKGIVGLLASRSRSSLSTRCANHCASLTAETRFSPMPDAPSITQAAKSVYPTTSSFAAAPDRVSAKRTLNISAPLNRRATGLLRADRYRSLMMWYHSGSRCATSTTVRGTRDAHSWVHERSEEHTSELQSLQHR